MNYKKIILVGVISLFVALLTSVLGVAGTVIGSVISSVLYNMFVEAFEDPVSSTSFNTNFEWEIAYIFPLVVIALIQLLLIFAILSQWEILPYTFLNAFLALQQFANNNLYKILAIAMFVISIYPIVVKPDFIKKSHGAIIAFVGLIFLARGFSDFGSEFTNIYDGLFVHFDFPIAVIALILIIFVIFKILMSAKDSQRESNTMKHSTNEKNFSRDNFRRVRHSNKHDDFDYEEKRKSIRVKNNQPVYNENKSHVKHDPVNRPRNENNIQFKENIDVNQSNEPKHNDNVQLNDKSQKGINTSSGKIHYESNDLLDDYKK